MFIDDGRLPDEQPGVISSRKDSNEPHTHADEAPDDSYDLGHIALRLAESQIPAGATLAQQRQIASEVFTKLLENHIAKGTNSPSN